MCLLAKRESCDLVSELAKVKRQAEQDDHNGYVFSRNHITNAGLQPGTTLCFLSPKCIIDVSTWKMVDPDSCSYVWLPNVNISGLPKEELCRSICSTAPNLQPLRNLFDDILGSNIGPALLAWASFYGLHQYQWLSANTRHFNIPILYGEPMVGKTLIAMCAAWLTGCKETHIASSTAHFTARDCHSTKELEHALNSSFYWGGLMCLLAKRESCDLVSELAKVKRQAEQDDHNGYVFSRNHITNAGLQPGTTLCFLSPKCIIDVSTWKMVDPDSCSYVWLPNVNISGLPKEELCRSICSTAPNLQPLRNLFDDILGSNIGPALLAWASFYGLHQYQWLSANTRHFNIPILYGEPMVGKTLIAMCAAWLTGCKETHIASRCTLAFVNSWLTKSTLPFIWDDPTTAEDVSQVAVDIYNGCVRGKSTDQSTKTPLTGCKVTVNFDLNNFMKYFSRVLVIKVEPPTKEKMPGDAKVLEDHSKLASAAFPIVLNALSSITVEQVHQETLTLKTKIPGADLRILEGIAYPLSVAKVITNLVDRGDLLEEVTDYLENVLVPYYQSNLSKLAVTSAVSQSKPLTVQMDVVNGATCTLVKSTELAMRKEAMAEFLVVSNVVDRVKELGGKVNKTVRINGRPTKCLTLPKTVFSKEKWQAIVNKIFDIQEDIVDPEEQEEAAEALLPQPIRQLNVTPVSPSLPPPSPIATTPMSMPPPSPSLPSPTQVDSLPSPQFVSMYPTPPSLPSTPEHCSTDDQVVMDDSFVLPPPPPSPTVFSEDDMDATLPMPPPELIFTEDILEPVQVERIAYLMTATPASPGNKCGKCRKVGRPGALWIQCCSCERWFHRACSGLTYSRFKQMTEDAVWNCQHC